MSTYTAFKLDERDLSFDDRGRMEVVTDIEALRQRLEIKINTHRGEWFLDILFGVPYREQILVKNPNLNIIGAAFKTVILDTPGVESIQSFDLQFSKADRTLSAEFILITEFGEVEARALAADAENAEAPDVMPFFSLTFLGISPVGSIGL